MSERYPRERSTDKEILVTKPYKTSPLIQPGAIYKQYVSNGSNTKGYNTAPIHARRCTMGGRFLRRYRRGSEALMGEKDIDQDAWEILFSNPNTPTQLLFVTSIIIILLLLTNKSVVITAHLEDTDCDQI